MNMRKDEKDLARIVVDKLTLIAKEKGINLRDMPDEEFNKWAEFVIKKYTQRD